MNRIRITKLFSLIFAGILGGVAAASCDVNVDGSSSGGVGGTGTGTAFVVVGFNPDGRPSILDFDAPLALPIPVESGSEAEVAKIALDYLWSSGNAELFGFRRGVDDFVYDSTTETSTGRHITFTQQYLPGDDTLPSTVPVQNAQVTVHLDTDGRLSWISNNSKARIQPRAGKIMSPQDAVDKALEYLLASGVERPAAYPKAEDLSLVVRRMSLQSADGSSEKLLADDRLAWVMLFSSSRTPDLVGRRVLVDAQTGEVLEAIDPTQFYYTGGTTASDPPGWGPACNGAPAAKAMLDAKCQAEDGSGVDRYNISRDISTSYSCDSPGRWATASCNESALRVVKQGQLWTYQTDPVGDGLFDSEDHLYQSSTNTQYPMAAVDVQHWGEWIMYMLAQYGVKARKQVVANQWTWTNAPLRMRTLTSGTPSAPGDVASAQWGEPMPNSTLFPDGFIVVSNGDGTTFVKDLTDSATLSHEFFHSVVWDNITHQNPVPGSSDGTKFQAFIEGACNTFAMLITFWGLVDVNHTYDHHLQRTNFISPADQALGAPNLESPRNSAQGVAYTAWLGHKPVDVAPTDPLTTLAALHAQHQNSTLFTLPMRLLAAGGPAPSNAGVLGANPNCVSLGAPTSCGPTSGENENAGYHRVMELLLELVRNQSLTGDADYYKVVDATATAAKKLWGGAIFGERVRKAFALAGFGRTMESEAFDPNDSNDSKKMYVDWVSPSPRNLIAVGTSTEHHSIRGQACCGDEDFFLLNEPVRQGDIVHFKIRSMDANWNPIPPVSDPETPSTSDYLVRFYYLCAANVHPCPINEGNPGDTVRPCSLHNQYYPPVDKNGFPLSGGSEENTPGEDWFKYTGLYIPPGVPTTSLPGGPLDPNMPFFVGVRAKAGHVVPHYELEVWIERSPADYYMHTDK